MNVLTTVHNYTVTELDTILWLDTFHVSIVLQKLAEVKTTLGRIMLNDTRTHKKRYMEQMKTPQKSKHFCAE